MLNIIINQADTTDSITVIVNTRPPSSKGCLICIIGEVEVVTYCIIRMITKHILADFPSTGNQQYNVP